ncbi:hypothetical protein HPB47_026189 [Ixodes persulcatus]|uniref:Uncharacterized protein n=1 Tax=Ixodes persulcatus TaxID=34615 RepID=A0AC60Q1F3_IXOPE|nr:hypothetical protein HPB47_026189 [Ixodes persulcatus]
MPGCPSTTSRDRLERVPGGCQPEAAAAAQARASPSHAAGSEITAGGERRFSRGSSLLAPPDVKITPLARTDTAGAETSAIENTRPSALAVGDAVGRPSASPRLGLGRPNHLRDRTGTSRFAVGRLVPLGWTHRAIWRAATFMDLNATMRLFKAWQIRSLERKKAVHFRVGAALAEGPSASEAPLGAADVRGPRRRVERHSLIGAVPLLASGSDLGRTRVGVNVRRPLGQWWHRPPGLPRRDGRASDGGRRQRVGLRFGEAPRGSLGAAAFRAPGTAVDVAPKELGPTPGRMEGGSPLRGQGALDGVVRSVPVREPAGRAWATPLPPRRGPPQRPSSRLGDPLSEATPAAAPAHADVHAGGTTGGRSGRPTTEAPITLICGSMGSILWILSSMGTQDSMDPGFMESQFLSVLAPPPSKKETLKPGSQAGRLEAVCRAKYRLGGTSHLPALRSSAVCIHPSICALRRTERYTEFATDQLGAGGEPRLAYF